MTQINPFIHVLAGIAFCMGLFSLIAFVYNKRQEFLYYTLYLLFTTVYFFNFPIYFGDGLAGYQNPTEVGLRDFIEVSINIFYTLFVVSYIDLKTHLRNAHRIAIIIVWTHVVLAAYYLFSLVFYNDNVTQFLRLTRVFALTGTYIALMLYILVKYRSRLVYITLLGSSFLMFGAIFFRIRGNSDYLILFICIELIVFGLGLLYKVRLIDIEKNKASIEAAINRKRALRAQINPHFIFNALSSIQGFITGNNRMAALKYLSKFSRLIRNILESSIETNVVLADEISMLKDYLELESLRFNNTFQYKIDIDDGIDLNAVEIPFMVLQPFVENAIIHGLLPKEKGERKLHVNFKKEAGAIVCEIDDNGVGRQAALQKVGVHGPKKKSRGLELTKQRLENLGLTKEPVEIMDKQDSNQEPSGTKVIIQIPAN